MWRNYFTVGIRSLTKNRAYAAINILGLAIGMAACLIILLFVRYEMTYDKALPEADRAFQFQTYFTDPDTGEEGKLQMAAYVSKAALIKDFPQIQSVVYALGTSPVVLKDGQATEVEQAHYVDGNLFDVLHYEFLEGDRATALARPGSLVITKSEATRFFGTEPAFGKTLTLVSRGIPIDFRITGIIADTPKNSHAKLSMVGRIDMVSFNAEQPQFLTEWGWQSGWVYVKLRPGADAAAINAQLPAWEQRNIPDRTFGDQTVNQGEFADFSLVNIADVHLGEAQDGAMTPGNTRQSIITFAIIAVLILAMACVNFTNLATARAGQRAREVALRKVLGANRRQLVTQFIGESILVAALAMLLALGFVELLLPSISTFLDASLAIRYFGASGLIIPIVGLVLVVGIAGGLYPALFLSRFQPARVLKANKSAAEASGTGWLRNALVVGQFAVSIGLIICTAIVYAQTVHARTSDPGYERDGLIQIQNISRRQVWPVVDTLIREIEKIDGVAAVGRSGIGIATLNNTNNGVQLPGRSEPVSIGSYNVDDRFFDTMGIKLIAGRTFDRNRPADDSTTPFPENPDAERAMIARGANIVITRLAARRMNFASPADAIGKTVKVGANPDYGGVLPATIIGVVEDARFRSIRDPIQPTMFFHTTYGHIALLVRYESRDPAAVREQIAQVWKRLSPDVPFDGEYSEDIIGKLYKAEAARAQTFAAFAILAVIVGCLGLFGLAAFTAERRTKEIGIRKVLGARTRDIVRLLVWQFSQPVVIANLIAWPVAWWMMRDWLNGFDTRIALTPTPFVLAGLLALAIAIATVAGHALRIARANPIHALRYE